MKTKPAIRLLLQVLLLLIFSLGCTLQEFKDQNNFNEFDLSAERALLSQPDLDSTLQAEKNVKNKGNNGNGNSAGDTSSAKLLFSTNYALQATVSAQSTYPGYSVNKIKDGDRNTTVGPSYSWANNFPGGGKLPESVFLKFSSLKTIDRIEIYTSSGYELQNYSIKYRTTTSASWITLLDVTGNTTVHRTHTFAPISILEVQIECKLGPPNQTIYGRLNEVELYGSPEPILPTIQKIDGILTFNSITDVNRAIDYLEYKYDQYSAAFVLQYPGKTADELADIEELTNFNDEQPYIDFENMYGFNSLRKKIRTDEDNWLATTAGDETAYPDPDDDYMDDDAIRTLVNSNGVILVGYTYYIFQSDGSYFTFVPPSFAANINSVTSATLTTLIDWKPGQVLPKGAEHKNVASVYIADPGCKSTKKNKGFRYNGNNTWRFKYKLKIADGPFDGNGKLRAWTISYKKKNGHWKRRGAHIEAYAYGNFVYSDCTGGGYLETEIKSKNGRRVKVKAPYTTGTRAFSGAVHSVHYHEKVGTYNNTLTW